MKKEQVMQLLTQEKDYKSLTNKELANKYGCGKATIDRALRELGLNKDLSISLKGKPRISQSQPELLINSELDEIITGSLLGDGYITPYYHSYLETGKQNKNSSLILKHGEKQREYVKFKQALIEKHINCYYREIFREDKREGFRDGIYIILETTQNLVFNKYRNVWYQSKKIVPRDLVLTPLSLAIWFQDDGSNSISGYTLATNGFTYDEVFRLKEILYRDLNILSNIHKAGTNYTLYIPSSSCKLFVEIITPYLCEDMIYKINHNHVSNKLG